MRSRDSDPARLFIQSDSCQLTRPRELLLRFCPFEINFPPGIAFKQVQGEQPIKADVILTRQHVGETQPAIGKAGFFRRDGVAVICAA